MSALIKLSDRFTETRLDDEIVIMRLDNGEFFALVGTAAASWRLIDGTRDRAALLSALTAEYAAEEAQITNDLDALLSRLRDTGLLARS